MYYEQMHVHLAAQNEIFQHEKLKILNIFYI